MIPPASEDSSPGESREPKKTASHSLCAPRRNITVPDTLSAPLTPYLPVTPYLPEVGAGGLPTLRADPTRGIPPARLAGSARPNHVLAHVVTLRVPRRFEFAGAAIVTVNKTGMTSNQPRDHLFITPASPSRRAPAEAVMID